MRKDKKTFKTLSLLVLLLLSIFLIAACGSKPGGMGSDQEALLMMEDKENDTAANQTAKQPAVSSANNGNQMDNSKLSGTYKWIHKNLESNCGGTAVAIGDVVEIVINSDGSGRFNTSIPFRLSGNELLIDWPLGDKGNSTMVGTLSITTIDGKTHLEGSVKTANPDGFYIKETWVMDKQ
jgi:hypothetical protein